LAKALATESNSTFFHVSPSDIFSKWVGESEKFIKDLFYSAKLSKPSIIFFDEVDAICSDRNQDNHSFMKNVKSELLIQMQGIDECEGVLVIGATNIPWAIDTGFRRRFQRRIHINLPNQSERKRIFEHYLNKSTHSLTSEQFEKLAQLTDGYSGSDISTIVQSSKLKSIKEFQRKVTLSPSIQLSHVEESLKVIKPTVTKLELKNYEKFAKEF
jgi:vacuolar protein-sorting-associated protein 4